MRRVNIFFILLLWSGFVRAQTNPVPQSLPYTQDFSSFTGTTTTYPNGMQGWTIAGSTSTSYPTAVPSGDQPMQSGGATNSSSSAFVGDMDGKMGMLNTSSVLKSICIAVNTTGYTGVSVSWLAATQRQQIANRIGAIGLQYRIGTSGIFTNVTASDYQNPGGSDNITGTGSLDPLTVSVTLPAACDNEAIVQLRWVYKEISGSGNRPSFSIDDISIGGALPPCTSPTAAPTNLVFGTITNTQIDGSFTASSPASDAYLVIVSINNSLTSNPVDGQAYIIGDNVGDGDVIGMSNSLSFSATGLSPATTYYFFIFSVNNNCTGGPLYLISTVLSGQAITDANAPPCVAPSMQPTNLVFGTATNTSIPGSFTGTVADEYIVVISTSATLGATPANGQVYAPGNVIGSGTVVQSDVVTSFTATSLSAGTTYYFFIFSYNDPFCTGGPVYNTTSPLTGNKTTLLNPCVTPGAQPTSLALNTSNTTISGSFNPSASADDYLVVRSIVSSLSGNPVNGTDYNPGDALGGGTVVSNSSSTSFISSGLTPGTLYYFFIFAANRYCSGGTKYLTTSPLTGNIATTSSGILNYYFGTLHSHSDYSDGNQDNPGYTPTQDYAYAQTAQCMDFLGISDHNHYSSLNNPGMKLANYHLGVTEANNYTNANPGFLALYGMEWGVLSGGGHVIVYGDGMDQLWGWETGSGAWGPTSNYDAYVQKNVYVGANGLFRKINDNIGTNTFAILAHPGPGDFSNLASIAYDISADSAIVGTAIENGPATSTNTTYTDPPSSLYYLPVYKTLLSKGYRLGPTIDHDNHNTTFGKTHYHRTAVIAPVLTKTAIISAIRNMRYYATQDCDTKVDFTINNQIMGSTLTNPGAPAIAVTITDATTSYAGATINLMSGVPGSGTLATIRTSATGATMTYIDNGLTNGSTRYYYLEIYVSGKRTVTSPIWYTRNDNVAPANDEAANAVTLTVGTTCTGIPYTNANATQSASEPFAACKGSAGYKTVWFKFTAPSSGAVKISNDYSGGTLGVDTRVALFSATDVNNYATYNSIACDDNSGVTVTDRSILYATGLTAGNTYYIQVDGKDASTTSGTFCINVQELTSSMLTSVTACTANQSLTSVNTNYTGWLSLVDASGNLSALIKNTGGGAGTSSYTSGQNINAGASRQDAVTGQYYLNRNFNITNASISSASIQFFFLNTELTSLQSSDAAVALSNLQATRQTGAGCISSFVAVNGTNSSLPQTANGSGTNYSWVQVTSPGLSNFYLHTSKSACPVKTYLQGAYSSALSRHKEISSAWATILGSNALIQPYTNAPYNYTGTESVSAGFFNATAASTDVMDWIILELRNSVTPSVVVARRAAFIREDGRVVDLNGVSDVSFRNLATNNYHIVLRHRNHLDIRTSATQLLDGTLGAASPLLYDFSTAQNKAYQDPAITSNPSQKDLDGGVFGMYAGNGNSNNSVRANGGANIAVNDYQFLITGALSGSVTVIISNVYERADYNMDGSIRANGGANIAVNDYQMLISGVLGGSTTIIITQHQ